jgi:hypothetical protein
VAYGTGSQALVNSAGTAGQVLTSAGAGVPTWATASGFTMGTPIPTTSGAEIEITGFPTNAKLILINFNKVSVSVNVFLNLQLGTASAYVTTGYATASLFFPTTLTLGAMTGPTTKFQVNGTRGTTQLDFVSGTLTLALLDSSTNIWSLSGNIAAVNNNTELSMTAGSVTLTNPLTRLKLFPNSAGTFDGGSVNILYS